MLVRGLEVAHQAVDGVLEVLDGGLRDMHVKLGRAERPVAEDLLNGAERDARFEEVRRVAMS
jgi:hypothetical protein